MRPEALSDEETAALPAQRPYWLCHLVAAGFAAFAVTITFTSDSWTSELGLSSSRWLVRDLLDSLGSILLGVALLPVYRRVSFRKRDVLFFVLFPFWGFVIAWKVGYRLTSLPYRDWSPRPDEYPRTRWIPRTEYHVLAPPAPPSERLSSDFT